MLEINGKKFLNEQEAICYLLNEVQTLKQSLGSALPDPIEGPEGPTGPTGATGPQGERGTGVFGCSSVLPSPTAYKDGDFYVLFNGDLYKKVTGNWILQTNLKGPQGPVGLDRTDDVVANPVGEPTDNLSKLEVSGTVYDIVTVNKLFGKFVKIIDAPESTTLTDEQIADIINGVFINGVFLNYKNPVLFPAGDSGSYYKGVIMSGYPDAGAFSIQIYRINKTTKEIAATDGDRIVTLGGIYSLNGKFIPDFPYNPDNRKILSSSTSNNLEWVDIPTAGMTVYRHNISLSTPYSGFTFYVNIILLSTDNAAYATVDEVWSKLYVGQTFVFGDKLALIKSKGAAGIDIVWVDDPNTTISIAKANTTFTSDSINSI